MAENILRYLAGKRGVSISTDSGGVNAVVGSDMSHLAKRVLEELNIPIKKHYAKDVTPTLVESSDLILTMEQWHKEYLLSIYPENTHKIHTLIKYVQGIDRDVPDPYGKRIEYYRYVRDILLKNIELLLDKLAHRRV